MDESTKILICPECKFRFIEPPNAKSEYVIGCPACNRIFETQFIRILSNSAIEKENELVECPICRGNPVPNLGNPLYERTVCSCCYGHKYVTKSRSDSFLEDYSRRFQTFTYPFQRLFDVIDFLKYSVSPYLYWLLLFVFLLVLYLLNK